MGHADNLQRARGGGAAPARHRLHRRAPALPGPRVDADGRLRADRDDSGRRAVAVAARRGQGQAVRVLRVCGGAAGSDGGGDPGRGPKSRIRRVLGRGQHRGPQGARRAGLRDQWLDARHRRLRAGLPVACRKGRHEPCPCARRGFRRAGERGRHDRQRRRHRARGPPRRGGRSPRGGGRNSRRGRPAPRGGRRSFSPPRAPTASTSMP